MVHSYGTNPGVRHRFTNSIRPRRVSAAIVTVYLELSWLDWQEEKQRTRLYGWKGAGRIPQGARISVGKTCPSETRRTYLWLSMHTNRLVLGPRRHCLHSTDTAVSESWTWKQPNW